MRKSFSLLAMGAAITASTGFATYWVMTNEETAAIAEIFICLMVAIMTATNLAPPLRH